MNSINYTKKEGFSAMYRIWLIEIINIWREFNMQISYHGHSIVKIKTGDYTILIDPFITWK